MSSGRLLGRLLLPLIAVALGGGAYACELPKAGDHGNARGAMISPAEPPVPAPPPDDGDREFVPALAPYTPGELQVVLPGAEPSADGEFIGCIDGLPYQRWRQGDGGKITVVMQPDAPLLGWSSYYKRSRVEASCARRSSGLECWVLTWGTRYDAVAPDNPTLYYIRYPGAPFQLCLSATEGIPQSRRLQVEGHAWRDLDRGNCFDPDVAPAVLSELAEPARTVEVQVRFSDGGQSSTLGDTTAWDAGYRFMSSMRDAPPPR